MFIPNDILLLIVFSLLFSTLVSSLLTPLLIKIGYKYNYLDYPSDRKIHKTEVVNIGGVNFILGIVAIYTSIYFLAKFSIIDLFDQNTFILPSIIFINLIIFFTGLFDDKYSLSPLIRLLIQFASSTWIWSVGFKISSFDITFLFPNSQIIYFPYWLSLIITVVWISGIINAINWLDGMDGLAAGISLILSLAILIISLQIHNYSTLIISASIVGLTLGFLFYNSKPAKIIMGDSGSNILGLNLALSSIILLEDASSFGTLPISFLIFLVPILDMIKVIFLRIKKGNSPFYPDKNHLHHQLLKIGFKERKVILIMYSLVIINLSAVFIIFNFSFGIPLFFSSLIFLILFSIFKHNN